MTAAIAVGLVLLGAFLGIVVVLRGLPQRKVEDSPPQDIFARARAAEAQRAAALDKALCPELHDCTAVGGVAPNVRCSLPRGHAGAHHAAVLTHDNTFVNVTW